MAEKVEGVDSNLDTEVTLLFNNAKERIRTIEKDTVRRKKEIVSELAKNLEGKIATDSICIEIVNQLCRQVSERFIRECLNEKYKQKTRVNNAKKQVMKIKDMVKEEYMNEKVVDELAVLPPLKYQYKGLAEENDKTKESENKAVVMINATTSGSTVFEETKEGEDLTKEREGGGGGDVEKTIFPKPPGINDKSFVYTSYSKEQQQSDEQDNNKDLKECPSCKELYDENCQLKQIIQKSDKMMIPAVKLYTKDPSDDSTINDKAVDSNNDTIGFEFSKTFKEIRQYMIQLFKVSGDNGLIWFNGKVDRKTGKTVHSGIGRLNSIQTEKSI